MYQLLIVLAVFCNIPSFANMAKPYTDGAVFSEMYGSENCEVISETINIDVVEDLSKTSYLAKYHITYNIYSSQDQIFPLLFVGDGLSNVKSVIVNNNDVSFHVINVNNYYKFPFIEKHTIDNEIKFFIRYQKDVPLEVIPDNLFIFESLIKEGKNIIEVEYEGVLGFNNFGFQRIFEMTYSLKPSKYWKSFGDINVELNLPSNLKIVSNNLNKLKKENNKYSYKVTNINDDIEIKLTQKTSIISSILLFFQPIGLAIIALAVLIYFHLKSIRKFRNNTIIFGGVFIVSILVYTIYFLSYDLIDFTLGNSVSKHGYIFLSLLLYQYL